MKKKKPSRVEAASRGTKPRRVKKPWGHETIWAETPLYVGKILHVKAGEKLSVQYHNVKDETIYLLAGRMRFLAGPIGSDLVKVPLRVGQSYRITPMTVHRMEAIEDCDILEASTPHLDDIVRLEDKYGRVPARRAGTS
jgi:mannose-6-phosphate isomerase-like protein (cupin superfamily)